MNAAPLVSIIIPVYNTEIFLCECLDSIVGQSFSDWEMILVDDGSTDRSAVICNDYASRDSRIHTLHKSNGGVSSARNAGLEVARGRWIMFVDSDDSLSPDALKLSVDEMERQNPDLVIFPTDSPMEASLFADTCYSGDRLPKLFEQNLGSLAFRVPWGKLFAKSLINRQNLRFDPSLPKGEDLVFFFSYLKDCRSVVTISRGLYHYRYDRTGLSKIRLMDADLFRHFFETIHSTVEATVENLHDESGRIFSARNKMMCEFILEYTTGLESLPPSERKPLIHRMLDNGAIRTTVADRHKIRNSPSLRCHWHIGLKQDLTLRLLNSSNPAMVNGFISLCSRLKSLRQRVR